MGKNLSEHLHKFSPKQSTNEDEDALVIQPTNVTPFVSLNMKEGILNFKGRSSPSASYEFYYPIMSSIDQAFANGMKSFTANFAFEYFNTSSSKCLFDILRRLSQFGESGVEVSINWFYEEDDEDMRETGEDYEDVLDLSFNYIEIQDF